MTRVGVVGTGIFARESHFPAMQKAGGYEVVGCYNRTKAKAEEFSEAVHAASGTKPKVYDTVDDLINDPTIEAVDILVPVQLNAGLVEKVIKAGKPVSFEKPIAATLEDARKIVKLAESTKIPVLCLENWCYHNSTKKLQELLPRIGKVLMFAYQATQGFRLTKYHGTTWRQQPQHIGGFLSDAGVHDMGFFTEVLGPVSNVAAHAKQLREESGAEDYLSSLLTLESGAIGTYIQGRYLGAAERIVLLQIFAENGSLVFERTLTKSIVTLRTGNTADEMKEEVFEIAAEQINGVVPEFENFAEAIKAGDKSKLLVSPSKAFHHYAIIAALIKSSNQKGSVVNVEQI